MIYISLNQDTRYKFIELIQIMNEDYNFYLKILY